MLIPLVLSLQRFECTGRTDLRTLSPIPKPQTLNPKSGRPDLKCVRQRVVGIQHDAVHACLHTSEEVKAIAACKHVGKTHCTNSVRQNKVIYGYAYIYMYIRAGFRVPKLLEGSSIGDYVP